jgi:hypothetical protein
VEIPPEAAPPKVTPPPSADAKPGWSERLQNVGALVAVGAGLFALVLIAVVAIAIDHDSPTSVASIATAAFGVIGSVVGAYFGVKVGADGTQRALDAHKAEAARAQAYAAHLPEARAREALIDADKMARGEPLDEQSEAAGSKSQEVSS